MSPRVLVCDDHPIVRDAVSACLKAIAPECEVGLCGSAGQALERLGEPPGWDLVLLDLGLPDASGLDALHQVRRCAPHARVAVLSARDDRDTVDRAMRAGAAGFVSKSADRAQLLASLHRLLDLPAPQAPGRTAPRSARPADEAEWVHDAVAALSPRQLHVLRLMLRGLPNREICEALDLSENTVKIHIGAVLRALRARNRTEAVARATRAGIGGE
jgi:DNA-binding NarL/FixJ family response regulator